MEIMNLNWSIVVSFTPLLPQEVTGPIRGWSSGPGGRLVWLLFDLYIWLWCVYGSISQQNIALYKLVAGGPLDEIIPSLSADGVTAGQRFYQQTKWEEMLLK